MLLAIKCSRCGKTATMKLDSVDGRGDFDLVALEAPEGFRKVQLGWNSMEVCLFCVDCSVAAETLILH